MEKTIIPLVNAVEQHIHKQPISFHVPGHKDGLIGTDFFPLVLKQILHYDLTELEGLDNLHAPSDAIFEAERLLTTKYKSMKSFFLVNGSTVGNLAMILSTIDQGDVILVQRNCHKSIINGIKLADGCPIFIKPEINEQLEIAGEISSTAIKEAFNQFPQIKAVCLTYPDYYGQTYDIEKIIHYSHLKGVPVLVDEAHGAHFVLGKPFPLSALDCGADLVVQSAHKTLPAMTMASFLHYKSNLFKVNRVREYLQMLQSSSPSYPLMMSLDAARAYLEEFNDEDIEYTIEQINIFKNKLAEFKPLRVVQMQDPLKIIVQSEYETGFSLQKKFEQVGIYTEMADYHNVLFIFPLLKKDGFYPFTEAIERIQKLDFSMKKILKKSKRRYPAKKIAKLELSFSEMRNKETEFVKLSDSISRIAAEMINPYPPGIPLIIEGEQITKLTIQFLEDLLHEKPKIEGGEQLVERKIKVFKNS